MKKTQISEHVTIDQMIAEVGEASDKATQVVGWYAHPSEVRGPFCRWFTVSDVADEYQKNVGNKSDDTRYASVCMNYAPSLAEEVIRLRSEIENLKARNLR